MRPSLISELERALRQDEFRLQYQPKVALATGGVVGVEALLRWEHPVLGFLLPSRFIPLSEKSSLIADIGAWVIRQVMACATRINQGRATPLLFSINASEYQFSHGDIVHLLQTALQETEADPSWFILELSEVTVFESSPRMITTLRRIRGMGITLSIDDFGVGYSCLRYVSAFPIGEIKIDRSFITDIHTDRFQHVIVETLVQLGRRLAISIVAEGVETEAEVAALQKLECPYAQGYFFGRPTSEAALLAAVAADPIAQREVALALCA